MIKQQVEELVAKIADLPQEEERRRVSIGLVNDTIESCGNYVTKVCQHVTGTITNKALFAGGHLDKENLRYRTEQLDINRRRAHDAAMANLSAFNRLCERYGVKHIAPDTSDRVKLGEFCAIVAVEFFMDGTGRSRDEIQATIDALKSSRDPMQDVVNMVQDGHRIQERPNVEFGGGR